MTRLTLVLFLISTGYLVAGTVADWTRDYDTFLKIYVVKTEKGGVVVTNVDYDKVRKAKATEALRTALASVSNLGELSKDEQLAFWLNAYNFLAIDVVIRNPGIKKLTDLSRLFKSVWKQEAGTVASRKMSLDDIEHGLIRKTFSEPRIHVALVCAARSCPNLRWEAYTADKLDDQLKSQLKEFTDNTIKGMRVDVGNERVYLSSIFKWFDEDFPGGPVPWLVKQGVLLPAHEEYSVKYLKYDWELNSVE